MKIVANPLEIDIDVLEKGTVVTLGAFDGMHIGHMELVRETERMAQTLDAVPVMLTFPLAGKSLFASEEKYAFIEENSQIELVIEQPFVSGFSDMSPEDFARKYLRDSLNCKCVVVGFNNRFGKMAAGDVEDMKHYGEKFGFQVVVVPPVCVGIRDANCKDDKEEFVVSSTMIKDVLLTGNVELAGRMLDRTYTIKGKVEHGKMLGRQIGFPTANIYPSEDLFLPKNGVYAASVLLGDGRVFYAMVNIGVNPTVKNEEKEYFEQMGVAFPKYKVEVYIFDFDEDIYGTEVEIQLEKFMRDECKFSGVKELTEVLGKDELRIRAYFASREAN